MKIHIRSFVILFLSAIILFSSCTKDDVIKKEEEPPIENPKPPTEYDPEDGSAIGKDIKIDPSSANVSEHQPGTDIDKTLDGDKSTIYHSRWGDATDFPVDLEYFFEDEKQIDYLVLYPRGDGNDNGWFKKIKIYTKTKDSGEYMEFGEFELKETRSPKLIRFDDGLENPQAIKIAVVEGVNNFASLAEIEFYRKNPEIAESLSIFDNKAATRLKSGVTVEQIEAIDNEFIRTMARAMYEGVYDSTRIGRYKSYPDPRIISRKNKTGTYGIYDNVTGIHVKWGTEMVVFMSDFEGEIALRMVNHNQGFGGVDYVLQPGLNQFKVETEGLAYLIYQDEMNHEVTANFATGEINGYFDISKHTNADWDEMISNASYSHFDILGELAHLTFTTDDLRKNTSDVEKLIGLYDDLVDMEQDFLGLYKYDRANKTRMYFRANTHQDMYMYATSYRTEYTKSTMEWLANPATLKSTPWGPAHEVGHVNQTRPGLKWLGLTEVTNNIYSLYVQTSWGNGARINVEDLGAYNNRYEKGFTGLLNQKAHAEEGDVFVKLIPFWQLQLYMAQVRDQEDFYKDVHEVIRVNENPETAGANQVEFVKIVSDVAKLDLTEFFKAWGFLAVGSYDLDDYGSGNLTVTQSMVDDAVAYIKSKGYPEPEAAVQYIHEESLEYYQNPGALNPGTAAISENAITITGAKNATVFQLVRDGKVIYVSPRNSFTVGSFSGADELYAVGYDGERKKVTVK